MKYISFILLFIFCAILSIGQDAPPRNKFSQLYQELPTPNVYRTASGAPGHMYWQQKADYEINIRLDDTNQRITGQETITYHNNSPDILNYLWLQLDQNRRAKDSDTYKVNENKISEQMTLKSIQSINPLFDGGFKLDWVKDQSGKPLNYEVVKTMMRVDLPQPLAPGQTTSIQVKWWYNINNRLELGGRSGYEYFPQDGNYLYTIAQFFPRMAVYSDDEGWQHKQFLGRGEFTLPFGDYQVSITVPSDHLVAATGVLQNEKNVLTPQQKKKLDQAKNEFAEPVVIVSEEEARLKEQSKVTSEKTWVFKAENVRDFAFASSRKFIWDAMAVKNKNGKVTMAMSMYPKEGNPLWEKYSTKVIAHTLKWYSHYTVDYPYPVAWSIHTDQIGMEYPMICFNGGRPESDGTYSERTKYGLIGVIIHEVGHNFFPMIINSDERQWTWMDEGLNSFVQFLTEQQWERDYPSRRGPANKIVDYMKGDKSEISPIMTNSESLFQFGNNGYAKPATALNILRETILGRELFDFAFKTYCERWKFKHPSPADFFRTMEDASGVDLDWFWWGWFFTTEHVDLSIADVNWYRLDTKNPDIEFIALKKEKEQAPQSISILRNQKEITQTQEDLDPAIKDFYSSYDPYQVTPEAKESYQKYYNTLSEEEKAFLQEGYNFYEITFENKGGLVMPLIIQLNFSDGTNDLHRIPAEIWRFNQKTVTKVFMSKKELTQIILDPYLETADVDTENNYFPAQKTLSKFELFQRKERNNKNPMQNTNQRRINGTN